MVEDKCEGEVIRLWTLLIEYENNISYGDLRIVPSTEFSSPYNTSDFDENHLPSIDNDIDDEAIIILKVINLFQNLASEINEYIADWIDQAMQIVQNKVDSTQGNPLRRTKNINVFLGNFQKMQQLQKKMKKKLVFPNLEASFRKSAKYLKVDI